MEPQAECMLVVIGGDAGGKKELLGFHVGVRESARSWREVLVELKARGLAIPPNCDRQGCARPSEGARGGVSELAASTAPCTRPQTCLDKLPTSVQPAAKRNLGQVWTAANPSRSCSPRFGTGRCAPQAPSQGNPDRRRFRPFREEDETVLARTSTSWWRLRPVPRSRCPAWVVRHAVGGRLRQTVPGQEKFIRFPPGLRPVHAEAPRNEADRIHY
jgi:hypothetical protein